MPQGYTFTFVLSGILNGLYCSFFLGAGGLWLIRNYNSTSVGMHMFRETFSSFPSPRPLTSRRLLDTANSAKMERFDWGSLLLVFWHRECCA